MTSAPNSLDVGRIRRPRPRLRASVVGWLFVVPALIVYVTFVLRPMISTFQYSLYDWNGIDLAQWVGLANYAKVFTDPTLIGSIGHAFILVIFFSILPITLGLIIATLVRDVRSKFLGTTARVLLFLPRVIPGAAAAVAWVWMYSQDGVINQMLRAVGLESWTHTWLGDFSTALPAVGIIGFWLTLGFCIVLLQSGIGKIDPSLYEAARLDGAGWWREFFSITIPGLRGEIGVCATMTIVAALASFDVVFMSTQGGPGYATMVPGVEVYRLAFTESRVGLASALAVVLMVLVLLVVGPLQRLFQEK